MMEEKDMEQMEAPSAYDVVAQNADYDDDPVYVGENFALEDYAARHINYYQNEVVGSELSDDEVLNVMLSVMRLAEEMFRNPGEMAADIASSVFDVFSNPIDEKQFFQSLKTKEPVSYKLEYGPDEDDVYIVTGYPAQVINIIEQALAIRCEDDDYKLTEDDIFDIIKYPLGWIYAIAENRASGSGRSVSTELMEALVEEVFGEISFEDT